MTKQTIYNLIKSIIAVIMPILFANISSAPVTDITNVLMYIVSLILGVDSVKNLVTKN